MWHGNSEHEIDSEIEWKRKPRIECEKNNETERTIIRFDTSNKCHSMNETMKVISQSTTRNCRYSALECWCVCSAHTHTHVQRWPGECRNIFNKFISFYVLRYMSSYTKEIHHALNRSLYAACSAPSCRRL